MVFVYWERFAEKVLIFVVYLNVFSRFFLIAVGMWGVFLNLNVARLHGASTADVLGSVVPVVSLNNSGKGFTTYGSAFVFQWKRRIVTTATVVDTIPAKNLIPESTIGVLTDSGKKRNGFLFHRVSIVHIDRDANIALLESDGDLPLKAIQKAAGKELAAGTNVLVSGCTSSGLVYSLYKGSVAYAFDDTSHGCAAENTYYGLGFPIGVGCNGGPVFDHATGALLGIVQVKSRFVGREMYPGNGPASENFGTGFVIPVSVLTQVLEDHKK